MKKVIVIILVALMLFALMVPCFAVPPDDYLFTFENLLGTQTLTLSTGQLIMSCNVVYGHKYYFRCFSSPAQLTDGNTSFQFYFGNQFGNLRYSLTLNNRFDTPSIQTSYGTGEVNLRYALYDGIERTFDIKFLLVDLTVLGLDNLSVSQASELFNSYSVDGYFPRGQGTYKNINMDFESHNDFYKGMFHVFDWLPEIVSTYSYPLVYIVLSLCITAGTLVFILIIKRYKT